VRAWVFLLIAILSTAPIGAQSTVRRARSMGWPLQKHIRPDDRVLILESADGRPLLVQLPDGDAAIHAMTDHTDVALVLIVMGKRSLITPRGNWIRSIVTGEIERILKPHERFRAAEGESIDFEEDGGIVQIGQTEVRAVVTWSAPVEIGGRYLLFANVDDGRLIVNAASMYEFAGPHLKRLMPRESPGTDGLEDPGFDEVLHKISERASRGAR
jgi:hypothetical protein